MSEKSNGIVTINSTWLQIFVWLLIICSTLMGGMWWLIGARTHAVLNDDFWASERIRPAMRLYIAENAVSREEFATFTIKWQLANDRLQLQLDAIQSKLDLLMEQRHHDSKQK